MPKRQRGHEAVGQRLSRIAASYLDVEASALAM
jgi:hypothetical protein